MTKPETFRVAVFTGGPAIRPSVRQFLCRLEADPHIQLVAVFWQTPGTGLANIVADAWRRRKILALPALVIQAAEAIRARVTDSTGTECKQGLKSRIHPVQNVHAPVVLDQLADLDVDLGLIYGGPILKPSLFQIPRHGTLGIHHGKLPEYRGKKTLFWAMYHGEEHAGVTIQRINEGLDTGEVVREGLVDVGKRRMARVWQDVEALGYDLYIQAIHDIRTGTATFAKPEGPRGKLFRDPKLSDLFTFYRNRWTGRSRKPHTAD